jgi:putative SbcD/Mre11-related phosphoesterase
VHLRFLDRWPAVVVEGSRRVLVIADLHFGIESDLAAHGVHIPSQSRARLERVKDCIGAAGADLLVLLGDVKHQVPGTSRQEFREIPHILHEIREMVDLRVAPGNHDGGIDRFLREGEILPVRGALIDGVGYLHGHTYPAPDLPGHPLVIGHHHPMVALRDEVGCALRAGALLLAPAGTGCLRQKNGDDSPATRVLVMPAFNELSGIDIQQLRGKNLGPLSRCMDLDAAEVYLTDGTYLGTAGSLRPE